MRFKRAEILSLARRLHLENVRVFGSVARDDANEASDVDILVSRSEDASAADVAERQDLINFVKGPSPANVTTIQQTMDQQATAALGH